MQPMSTRKTLLTTVTMAAAFSGSTMDELNIRDSSDYEAIVPPLSVRNSPSRLFIRGVGRVTNNLGTDPGVAVLNGATSLTTQR